MTFHNDSVTEECSTIEPVLDLARPCETTPTHIYIVRVKR